MSAPRFAAITAELLARKGEARPWAEGSQSMPVKTPLAWARVPEPLPAPAVSVSVPVTAEAVPPVAAGTAACRKIAVRLSEHDYQRLGILAVKEGSTRQRLLQDAMERLFSGLSRDYGAGCACLGPETPR